MAKYTTNNDTMTIITLQQTTVLSLEMSHATVWCDDSMEFEHLLFLVVELT